MTPTTGTELEQETCRQIKANGSRCRRPVSKDKKANGYCYYHMVSEPRQRRGFGSVKKHRSGKYHASYAWEGDRHNAPYLYADRETASIWLRDERRLIEEGRWTSPRTRAELAEQVELKKQAEQLHFRDYADRWLETRTNKNGQPLKTRSKADYRRLLKAKINPTFGDIELKHIAKAGVQAWYMRYSKTPTEQASAYALFRTILNSAVEDELIPTNPCRVKGAGKAPIKHKVQMATAEEISTILAIIPGRWRLTVQIALWCTLRIGEILELRRSDIRIKHIKAPDGTDVPVGVIRVRRTVQHIDGEVVIDTPKTEKGAREVHIPPALIPEIEAHLKSHAQWGNDGLLFPSGTGASLHHRTFGNWWNKARIAAGRPDLRFHDLRHTGATMLAQEGATIAELMDRLGHTTPKAALIYQHTAAGRDQQMAERLSGRMTTGAWSIRAGGHTLSWSTDGITGSPELVDEVKAMAERSERVRTTPGGPMLTIRLTEPLSIFVAATQVMRALGATGGIETDGNPPAAPHLRLGASLEDEGGPKPA